MIQFKKKSYLSCENLVYELRIKFSNFGSFPKLGHTMDVWIYSSVAHDYGIFLQTYFFIWYIKILKVKLVTVK